MYVFMICDVQPDALDLAGGEADQELHSELALMMCNVSSDSVNLDGEEFERLQPSLRIAAHATRDDSDESGERGGPHNLPSGCTELLITIVVPPEGLEDLEHQIALDARISQCHVIKRSFEERKIRNGMRRHAWKLVLLSK